MSVQSKVKERFAKYQRADDLGISSKVEGGYKRTLNKNGTFNINRIGGQINLYHKLIDTHWIHFIALIFLGYLIENIIFAFIYVAIGVEHITGIVSGSFVHNLAQAFFFSAQTLTTVGYGVLAPKGGWTSFAAALEAVIGLLSFSLATGLFYGRFTKPRKAFLYSEVAVITPYENHNSLQVRVAYKQNNLLLDLEASMILTMVVNDNGVRRRKYHTLKLETAKVVTLPLNWNIVHIIDEESPLYEIYPNDFKDLECEIIVLVKGFSETYGQVLHSRTSYIHDEIRWGKKFKVPYSTGKDGNTHFDLELMHEVEELAS